MVLSLGGNTKLSRDSLLSSDLRSRGSTPGRSARTRVCELETNQGSLVLGSLRHSCGGYTLQIPQRREALGLLLGNPRPSLAARLVQGEPFKVIAFPMPRAGYRL